MTGGGGGACVCVVRVFACVCVCVCVCRTSAGQGVGWGGGGMYRVSACGVKAMGGRCVCGGGAACVWLMERGGRGGG